MRNHVHKMSNLYHFERIIAYNEMTQKNIFFVSLD